MEALSWRRVLKAVVVSLVMSILFGITMIGGAYLSIFLGYDSWFNMILLIPLWYLLCKIMTKTAPWVRR